MKLLLTFVTLVIFVTACGKGSVSSSSLLKPSKGTSLPANAWPECGAASVGTIVYSPDSGESYICNGTEYLLIEQDDSSSSTGGDDSSSSTGGDDSSSSTGGDDSSSSTGGDDSSSSTGGDDSSSSTGGDDSSSSTGGDDSSSSTGGDDSSSSTGGDDSSSSTGGGAEDSGFFNELNVGLIIYNSQTKSICASINNLGNQEILETEVKIHLIGLEQKQRGISNFLPNTNREVCLSVAKYINNPNQNVSSFDVSIIVDQDNLVIEEDESNNSANTVIVIE